MREWIITAAVTGDKGYKIFEAAAELDGIWWTASAVTKNIEVNDIVYMYIGVPYSKIMYKFKCTDVVKGSYSDVINDDLKYWNKPELHSNKQCDSFKIDKLQFLDDDNLSLKKLNQLGLIKTRIQGSYKSDNHPELFRYIGEQFDRCFYAKDDLEYNIQVNSLDDVSVIDDIPVEKNATVNEHSCLNYVRDPKVGRYAIKRAEYKCEIDESHMTFISRKTGKPYLESHHLIPISAQNYFDNSLDVPANIVALCSSCHNEIHYGKDAGKIIIKLYKTRKERLLNAGIDIELQDLLKFYNL